MMGSYSAELRDAAIQPGPDALASPAPEGTLVGGDADGLAGLDLGGC